MVSRCGYLAGSKILTGIKSSKPSAKYFPSLPGLATGKIATAVTLRNLPGTWKKELTVDMRRSIFPGLLLLILSATLSLAAMTVAKNPPRVELNAIQVRNTRIAGGDWDDRTEKIQLEITATNLDLNHPAEGLVLHYWILSESQVDHRTLKVVDAGQFDVNLTAKPEGRQLRQQTPLIQEMWDNTDAVFGARYKGWLLVLTNANNELVAVKSCQPAWQSHVEEFFALKKGAWCDRNMKPASEPVHRN
jgi:hypothetical protein